LRYTVALHGSAVWRSLERESDIGQLPYRSVTKWVHTVRFTGRESPQLSKCQQRQHDSQWWKWPHRT